MKQFITLIIATALTTIAVAQKAVLQTKADEMNLKGKVKSILEMTYEATDQNGQMIKGALINYLDNPLYEFDKSGNLISKTVYMDGNIDRIYNYKYSKPGLLTEQSNLNSDKKLLGKSIYEYDKNDFLVKWINYDSLGKISDGFTNEFKFTDEHNYVLIRKKLEGQVLYTDTISLFNDNKIRYQTDAYANDFTKTTYFYNSARQKTRSILEKKDGTKFQEDMEWDSHGNMTKLTMGDIPANAPPHSRPTVNVNTNSYEYTYDTQGNWTQQIHRSFDDNIITERTIEYY